MIGIRRLVVLSCLLSLLALGKDSSVLAQPPASESLQVVAQNDGVEIVWTSADTPGIATAYALPNWPLIPFGTMRLPARLVPLRLPDDAPLDMRLVNASSVQWEGNLADIQPEQALAKRSQLNTADLPDRPVVVLREGRLRGARIVVLAISALFEQNGTIRATTDLHATVAAATPFTEPVGSLLATTEPFITAGPGPNPQANQPAVLLRVTRAGMQRVDGAALTNAGLDLHTLDPTRLHLRVRGGEVALELRGTADGRLDANDELRFFAASPGDRWNSADTYWLSIEATPGLRMGTRSVATGIAPTRTTAIERSVWRGNQLYNPALSGADGDHWFSDRLTAGPGTGPMALGVPLTPTLPLAAGTTVLTVTGSTSISTNHILAATFGGVTVQTSGEGQGNLARHFTFNTNGVSATVALLPGTRPNRIDIDSLAWERPVALDFAQQGAVFYGVNGTWSYQLANTPAGATLYDVSDPVLPDLLATANGGAFSFEDGPSPRKYLVTGPETLHTPEASAHQPVDLTKPQAADVLFIGPAIFHPALQPLVDLRTSQGYRAALVDTQAIYNAWSYGQTDPEAIRSFLRYAATAQPAPTAVVLVGDGTSDPRNYTGRNNTTFVPPYLAPVDPFQGAVGFGNGETACETCYVQLDGDNPLSDPLPDLALGRLPVKSVAELTALVAKIVAYERTPPPGFWRSRALFITDNGTDADGKVDPAGNFFGYAEQSISLQPSGITIQRLFYDPTPATNGQPGHEADPQRAFERTKTLLSSGAAFVTYMGHSHEWQWAVTDLSTTPNYLLGLYDADELTNGLQLPILLEMTCLTSAFQTPAFSGTTLDERLLLNPNGGAIAVWGSTGKGVSEDHNKLQEGFYRQQWGGLAAGAPTPVGALTLAGYLALFAEGGDQDGLRTFALLGDPLTMPQARFGGELFLPIVQR